MKTLAAFFIGVVAACVVMTKAQAQTPTLVQTQVVQCERVVRLRLSQTSYSLNVWKHIRNAMNATEFNLPVSCQFYDSVQVGDDILSNRFRWGSLAVHGSMGTWNLTVEQKL